MYKVCVASLNPVKVQCVKNAFEKVFTSEKIEVTGVNVPSGVSDQPMSDNETYNGAINRAKNAMEHSETADFYVGIEGGVQEENGMQAFAWIVVLHGGEVGKAKTAVFYLPEQIRALVHQGVELGHADDQVFGRSNSKQKDGAIGILTQGLIDRTNYYEHATIMALIPFINKNLYFTT